MEGGGRLRYLSSGLCSSSWVILWTGAQQKRQSRRWRQREEEGEPRAWRAVSPGLEKKVRLWRLTLLTLEQAGRVQTPAHPPNKTSLDLQSLPVTAERMLMWGLHSRIKKITNPTLEIALRLPSQAAGLNLLCLAGRLPKTLHGCSNALTQRTTP